MPILFLIALAQKIIIDYPKILLKKKPQIISLLFLIQENLSIFHNLRTIEN